MKCRPTLAAAQNESYKDALSALCIAVGVLIWLTKTLGISYLALKTLRTTREMTTSPPYTQSQSPVHGRRLNHVVNNNNQHPYLPILPRNLLPLRLLEDARRLARNGHSPVHLS